MSGPVVKRHVHRPCATLMIRQRRNCADYNRAATLHNADARIPHCVDASSSLFRQPTKGKRALPQMVAEFCTAPQSDILPRIIDRPPIRNSSRTESSRSHTGGRCGFLKSGCDPTGCQQLRITVNKVYSLALIPLPTSRRPLSPSDAHCNQLDDTAAGRYRRNYSDKTAQTPRNWPPDKKAGNCKARSSLWPPVPPASAAP